MTTLNSAQEGLLTYLLSGLPCRAPANRAAPHLPFRT